MFHLLQLPPLSSSMNHKNPLAKDLFVSPNLSLSLAGVFRNNALETSELEEEDKGSAGAGTSGDNSGPVDRYDGERESNESLNDEREVGDKRKRRRKYHRHTAEQIREMEVSFKESPHPDEKQRQQLSKQLGLSTRQVKFWFQNRRSQIKAAQERYENSLLKSEIEKLQEENPAMRETLKKACCPSCDFTATAKDNTVTTEEQLRIENAKLKAEVEKLHQMQGSIPTGTPLPNTSSSAGTEQNKCSLNSNNGFLGLEKSRILEIVNSAVDELTKMCTAHEPLWIASVETGREILNYDEYVKEFSHDILKNGCNRNIEASRETGVVFFNVLNLVQAFMDLNQWKEMFPCLISDGSIVKVICSGLGDSKEGTTQLMFAEIQMLTPQVPTREIYFVRHCRKVSPSRWAILDLSIDKLDETIDASLMKCRKRPSGCIIEDQDNGHCKVTWVEHWESQRNVIPTLYRSIITNGLAFGARHWMLTLQLYCERSVFFMATNVPTRDCNGVSTLAGRKSIRRLGQRMTASFCKNIGAQHKHTWNKVSAKGGDEIRFRSRKNFNDPGEPLGVIVCAVMSTWMPVPASSLFNFLRDDSRRSEWDTMLTSDQTKTLVKLAKGQDRRNSITVHATTSSEKPKIWFLQDSSTNSFESMVVLAPVNIDGMQLVMAGCDSSSLPILPSGFSILPDGFETRPLVITSRPEERATEGGSLLTIAFQVLANSSPSAKLTMESMETVNALVSCTLQNIKKAFQCEDG